MKIFTNIFKYLPVVVGITILWFSIYAFATIFNSANKHQLELVPSKSNFVFKLNFKDFLKSSTYSMIFQSKDQKLLNTFQEYLKKQTKGTGKSDDFGINFFSDVIIYGEKLDKGQVYVLLFNLIDEKKFTKNLPYFLNAKQSMGIKNNVGVLVTYYGENKIEKEKLSKYLENLKIQRSFKNHLKTKNEFFHVDLNNFAYSDNFNIEKGKIYTNLTEKELNIKGEILLKHNFKHPSSWVLKENNDLKPFHMETAILSSSMVDTICTYFSKIGLQIPEFAGFSFNYYGIEIQETENGIIFSPKFDLILNLKKNFQVKTIVSSEENLKNLGFTLQDNQIIAGKISYSHEFLDEKTLFLGCNREMVKKKKNFQLLKISGDLAKITEISGGGFIKSIINVIPPYKAAKDFFGAIQEYKLFISPKNDRLVYVRGKIKLQDKYYLYNEFLKFYLTLKGNF